MYFLLRMGIFQPAMLVYQRVIANLSPDSTKRGVQPQTHGSVESVSIFFFLFTTSSSSVHRIWPWLAPQSWLQNSNFFKIFLQNPSVAPQNLGETFAWPTAWLFRGSTSSGQPRKAWPILWGAGRQWSFDHGLVGSILIGLSGYIHTCIHNIYIYTPGTQFVLCFRGWTLQNKAFSNQNRGLLGSRHVYTLPETNIFAPENWWLEDNPFLLRWPIFRGYVLPLVSGSVYMLLYYIPFAL